MMMLTTDEVEYDVAEFYKRFSDSLPKIVKVSQGFYGCVMEDTFDKHQIIRLHTISRQKRVVAKTKLRGELKYISIPLDYQNMKLCVIDKKGNVGKEKDLADIVKKQKALHVNVQFPKDKVVAFGNVSVGTSNLPNLELTSVFEEVYFLGNFVNDGEMASEVIHVPLYLTQLRLTLVTGIADQPLQAWNQLQVSLSDVARGLRYNKDFGNPEIAEYTVASFVDTSTDLYSYITPSQYYNFLPLAAGNRSIRPMESQEHKTKDPSTNIETKRARNTNTKTQTTNKITEKVYENLMIRIDNDAVLSTGHHSTGELTESGENMYEIIENINRKTDHSVKTSIDNSENKQGTIHLHSPPPLPPRHGLEKPNLEQSKKSKEYNHYENNLQRGREAPTVKDNQKDEQTAHSSIQMFQNELKTKLNAFSKTESTRKAMPAVKFYVKPDQKSTTADRNQQDTVDENKHHQTNTLNTSISSSGSQEHKAKVLKPFNVETKRAKYTNTKTQTTNKITEKVYENLMVRVDNAAVLSTRSHGTEELTENEEIVYETMDNVDTKTVHSSERSIASLVNLKQGKDNIDTGIVRSRLPPPIPAKPSFQKTDLEQRSKESKHCENNLPRGRVTPIIKGKVNNVQYVHSVPNLIQNELKTKLNTTSKSEATRKAMPAAQCHAKPEHKSTTVDSNQPDTVHEDKHHQTNTLNTSISSSGSQEHKAKDSKQFNVETKRANYTKTKTQTTNKIAENLYENLMVRVDNNAAVLSTRNHGAEELTDSGENVYETMDNIDTKTDHSAERSIASLVNLKQGKDNIDTGIVRSRLPPAISAKPSFQRINLEQKSKESKHCENNLPRGRVTPIIKGKENTEHTAHASIKLIQNELKTKLNTPSISVATRKAMPTAQFNAKPDQKSTIVDSNQTDTGQRDKHLQRNTPEHNKVDVDVCKPMVGERKQLPPVNEPNDITKLTIDDVSEYLRVLRLETYIEEFRNQQVDGEILPELDRDMLKNEFGMKAVEATRLLQFATKGQLPKYHGEDVIIYV